MSAVQPFGFAVLVIYSLFLSFGVDCSELAALRLTKRSACPQGASHFVFIMSRTELAYLSCLFIITELVF